jgi:molybdopterin/thiamine biosynthesis adenylyltransferase
MTHDLTRYHRQMLLPGFGEDGQRRLLDSTALILGCGALGTVAANMLARAGVGHLVIVDRDYIELTNLQRQTLFDEQDVADGIPKAEAAKRRLTKINSQVEVTAIVDDINYRNIERFAEGADIFIDGLDNFETRYLANDLAVRKGTPYMYGGAVGTVGMAYAILPNADDGTATPCLRCLFEQAPPPGSGATCDTVGVIGPVVSIIANFQVNEALKILTGNIARVNPTMLNIDLWTNMFMQLKVAHVREEVDCPCCKQRTFEYLDGKAGSSSTSLCGRDAVQLTHKQKAATIDLDEIASRLRQHGNVKVNEFMLRASVTDNHKPYELTLFVDGRAIVKGTGEASVARSVFAKFVGS